MNVTSQRLNHWLAITSSVIIFSLACNTVTQLLATAGAQVLDVRADEGWQQSPVDIVQGQYVTIEAISGKWFEDPPGVWHDAGGGPNPWRCGNPACHEPLPNFPKYALIGRLGETGGLLPIGARLVFVAGQSGRLYLRPNYGDVDIPIFRPEGYVRVRIMVRWN